MPAMPSHDLDAIKKHLRATSSLHDFHLELVAHALWRRSLKQEQT
jgi:hypothetical protein